MFDRIWHVIGQRVRPRTIDVFILKTPHPIQLRFIQPIQQGLKLGLGFTWIADNERRTQGNLGADITPRGDLIQRFSRCCRPRHPPQNSRMRMLERYVQIGQDQPLSHQRDQIAHMGIGVNIMQPHPSPK